ncbi:hypothetical protein [Mycolicibacterium llatzerense]|uniref:hypothetical protein n=1 Tax=Mycolicibacterium llatzerense TaxID=280871 RepID=UPI0008DEA22B|nr:hypothetical protein [Mycolicibacterium llatzerense]
MAGFSRWLDTFVDEKGLNTDHRFNVEGPEWGWNSIPLSSVIEAAKQSAANEQAQIKSTLVEADYRNSDPMHFFEHLAKGMAK